MTRTPSPALHGPARGGSGASHARAPCRARTLDLVGREGVAGARLSGGAAGVEPARPLLGASVGEGVRVHAATGARLEAIVADGLGSGDGFVDVALLEVARLVDGVGPHARVAVGLELEP